MVARLGGDLILVFVPKVSVVPNDLFPLTQYRDLSIALGLDPSILAVLRKFSIKRWAQKERHSLNALQDITELR